MTIDFLDFVFPFIVLFYGALMTFVLNAPRLMALAEQRFPPKLMQQMQGHRVLAMVCLVVGGLWSLQNIWGS